MLAFVPTNTNEYLPGSHLRWDTEEELQMRLEDDVVGGSRDLEGAVRFDPLDFLRGEQAIVIVELPVTPNEVVLIAGYPLSAQVALQMARGHARISERYTDKAACSVSTKPTKLESHHLVTFAPGLAARDVPS